MVVSTEPDNRDLFAEFQLPEQDLKRLTFCGSKPRQLQTWLDELPATQVKNISIVFYKLLPEINHLDINYGQRLGLMGILRPYAHRCIEGLADGFLKQPLSLSDNMTKIAAIAQALQRHLCDGYMLIIREILQSNNSGESLSARTSYELSMALYYAIHGLGQLLYRSYQLYVPRPPMLWKKLNQLHELTIAYGLETNFIKDELLESRNGLSAQQAYYRTLILACSNTNQLRQADTHYLYNALEQWASMIDLHSVANDKSSFYWIDKESDEGPFYKTRYSGPASDSLCAINLQNLVDLISTHQISTSEKALSEIPIHFRQSLITHLHTCWTHENERAHPRKQVNIELDVCIGLKAAHQQLRNGIPFDTFLNNGNEPPKSSLTMDGYTSVDHIHYESETQADSFMKVVATDISDKGYCLQWSRNVPPQVKAGEIILLKKPDDESWQVGAIRWAQRLNSNTYVGVQVLEGYAEPSAASTKMQDGQSTPFFRTVLLKDKQTAEIMSLITPTIPFAPQQNIELQAEGTCNQAQLVQLLLSSGSISQYSYRSL